MRWNEFFYKTLIFLSKRFGIWIFILMSRMVSTGYFLLFPKRVAASVRFYRALFPLKSRIFHIWCAFQQYHQFTYVFLDRFLIQNYDDISFSSKGIEHLKTAVKKRTGGIILMSHMGNWEVAANLLKQKLGNVEMLLYMGIKHKEQIEGIQKESIQKSGIRIVGVSQKNGSPLDIVEGINVLKTGGIVSMTGDKVWDKDQRVISVHFLGYDALLPAAPYMIALISGAPIFIFFSFRTGHKKYSFTCTEPIYIRTTCRSERDKAIKKAAQHYADILEHAVRQYPFQWYHFEQFINQ